MPVLQLTAKEHGNVLRRLVALAKTIQRTASDQTDSGFAPLMTCFLFHQVATAEALLKLVDAMTSEWFPTTVGYVAVRSMFEVDVTAHYIAKDPENRTARYAEFGAVTRKQAMDACDKHRRSSDDSWREGMEAEWRGHWAPIEDRVNSADQEARSKFWPAKAGKSRTRILKWSDKNIAEMAREVRHESAYDVFYANLSHFTHVDINLAARFLRAKDGKTIFSQRAAEFDVGSVFRYAAIFLTCFLNFYGKKFGSWTPDQVSICWSDAARPH